MECHSRNTFIDFGGTGLSTALGMSPLYIYMLGTALLFVALLLSNQKFEQGQEWYWGWEMVAKQQTNKQVVFLTQDSIHPPSGEWN